MDCKAFIGSSCTCSKLPSTVTLFTSLSFLIHPPAIKIVEFPTVDSAQKNAPFDNFVLLFGVEEPWEQGYLACM